MVKLVCAIVGVAESAFPVDIDASQLVGDLKKAIWEEIKAKFIHDDKFRSVVASGLQLFLAKTEGGAWLTDDDQAALDLEDGKVHEDIQALIDGEKIKATKTLQHWLFEKNKMPQPSTDQIHVLVVVPKQAPPVNPPQIFYPPFRPIADGLNVEMPHLSRDALMLNLYSAIIETSFVLLSSPAGSGKTSLLAMFARQYPDFRYVPIAFDSAVEDATTILFNHGVDVRGKKCSVPEDKLCVVMMDDCQRQYKDLDFWVRLIKGSATWLPTHVRFIISATHLLETDAPSSPVAFNSISWKLTRDDFLISDAEAHEFLNLENGLPASLRQPTFLEVIIRECNGHIGSLRVSVNTIYTHFKKARPTEHDLLAYYMSGAFVDQMARCFGSDHRTPTHPDHQRFLTMCLVDDPAFQPLVQDLSDDENQCFTRLKKAGIVFEDGGYVKFTSPLAERYYYKWLFPGRGYVNPASLYELVRKAIGSMSASVLKQSVVREYDFPKEAVFQHQFMAALALHTTSTCYICPELSRVFPASPRQRSQRINGEIDFYLNGSLRWGIELLVNGDKIGEHMSRFATGGKYAALAAKEYVVIDFRGNMSGTITNVVRKQGRVTVFFKLGDFSSCRCIFGLGESSELISLNH